MANIAKFNIPMAQPKAKSTLPHNSMGAAISPMYSKEMKNIERVNNKALHTKPHKRG